MEKLTKENFWDELQEKYPIEFQKFNDWIDNYKKDNNWDSLFKKDFKIGKIEYAANGEMTRMELLRPKYHDLPKAMQIGIFMEFASQAKEVYGIDDIQLLPEIDTDVQVMHTYESMPDLIRGFFFNIKRKLSYKL